MVFRCFFSCTIRQAVIGYVLESVRRGRIGIGCEVIWMSEASHKRLKFTISFSSRLRDGPWAAMEYRNEADGWVRC